MNHGRNFLLLTLAGVTQSYSCPNFCDCELTVPSRTDLVMGFLLICSSCSNYRSCYPGSDSIGVLTNAGRLFKLDAENLARIPKGVYSACGAVPSGYPLFTLRIQGIESFQINYCFDQLPCTIRNFQGAPLPSSGSLIVIPQNTTCGTATGAIHDFPNKGVSLSPSANGHTYSFGTDPIDASYTPMQYRVCWRSDSGALSVPAGTLIVHSYETYYREFVVTDPDWQPFDSIWKITFLSLLLLVAISAAALLPPLIGYLKSLRKKPSLDTTNRGDPIIARMCDEEVSVNTIKALSLIVNLPEPEVTERVRVRRKRSELAHAIFCVSDM